MGNTSSAQPPLPSPPIQSMTLPLQRVPTTEGGSGLHYSGEVYLNQAAQYGGSVCPPTTISPDHIADLFTGNGNSGVSSPSLQEDTATHRISQQAIASHVETLITQGKIPGTLSDFSAQIRADKEFYANVSAEFCFYEARYIAALSQFLEQVATPGTNTTDSLNQTIALNRRLNSLLEVINYVGNERARQVNSRSTAIDKANATIQERLAQLNEQKNFLQHSDAATRSQTEMMRYSAEKNRAMTIQILFFVGLNVVALGTILTVYKSGSGVG